MDAPAFEDWQREVIAYQSPVPLLAAFRLSEGLRQGLLGTEIVGQGARISSVEQQLKEDLRTTCLPGLHDPRLDDLLLKEDLRATCLPGMHDPRLDDLLQQECEHNGRHTVRGGRLIDAHVHINGSTEATVVWLHALTHPASFCKEVRNSIKKNAKAHIFLHQLHTSEQEIFKDLRRAVYLRQSICCLLRRFQQGIPPEDSSSLGDADAFSWAAIATRLRYADGDGLFSSHPLRRHDWTELQSEGLFWLRALATLWQTSSPELAALLHYYLLLMHQFFRLLVQHPDQYGFDQFQYITLDGGREAVENNRASSFQRRFSQFCGMYGTELGLLEARFSPKDSVDKKIALLRELRELYNNDRELYHKIKELPMKSRVLRDIGKHSGKTVAFISSEVKTEFYLVNDRKAEVIDFLEAVKYLKAHPEEQAVPFTTERRDAI